MGSATAWAPRAVPRVESRYRRIVTDFPVPESIPVLETLEKYELRAMGGQPPVVWDRAEGFQVYDRWGNMWLDWSSGVLITNAGHGRQEIVEAIKRQADAHLLANYAFPSELRAELCRRHVELAPEPLKKIFLLTTGSEAVEFAIKVARTHGQKVGGRNKRVIVSFEKAFHGRTLGSQLAGGIPALKEWIGAPDATFVQVPFPDGYWTEDTSFELFEKTLGEHGVAASGVCGVIMETYQGGTAAFAPPEYVKTRPRARSPSSPPPPVCCKSCWPGSSGRKGIADGRRCWHPESSAWREAERQAHGGWSPNYSSGSRIRAANGPPARSRRESSRRGVCSGLYPRGRG